MILSPVTFTNRVISMGVRFRLNLIIQWLELFFCWKKKFLLFNLVSRNIKIKYRRSIIGVFWTILSPSILSCTYYFMFKKVFKVQTPNYFLFVVSGTFFWNFFSRTISESTDCLTGNSGLINKIPIPLQVFPWAIVLTNFLTLLLSCPVILAAAFFSNLKFTAAYFLLPFYILGLFLMAYSFSLLVSYLYVFFRDLRHIVELFLNIWFFATPVTYSALLIPLKWKWILFLNPLGYCFQHIHEIIMDASFPALNEVGIFGAWVVAVIILSQMVCSIINNDIVENL